MTLHAFTQYLKYRWKAKTRHGVHSPFVYSFIDKGLSRKEDLDTIINSYFAGYTRLWLGNTDQLDTLDMMQQNSDTIIVVPNIHVDKKATMHWERAATDPHVKLSIDLYQLGLLFFKDELKEKQHFVLKFPL